MTNGQSGEKPEFYDVVKAAVYYHMSPDDVIRLPVYWIEAAASIIQAESAVMEKKQAQQKKKGGRFSRFRR